MTTVTTPDLPTGWTPQQGYPTGWDVQGRA
jgi:hypothetical protein